MDDATIESRNFIQTRIRLRNLNSVLSFLLRLPSFFFFFYEFVHLRRFILSLSDPVIMSVKSSTSYAQEDLDLINSEILNLEYSTLPLLLEARTPKSDSCGETCYSRPESSMDSLNPLDSIESIDNGYKMPTQTIKEETMATSTKDQSLENSDNKVNTVAMQLGIVEQPGITIKTVAKNLIIKDELKDIKLPDDKEFEKTEELKPKVLNRDGLKFFSGAKLEVKDFNEIWQVHHSRKQILVKATKM